MQTANYYNDKWIDVGREFNIHSTNYSMILCNVNMKPPIWIWNFNSHQAIAFHVYQKRRKWVVWYARDEKWKMSCNNIETFDPKWYSCCFSIQEKRKMFSFFTFHFWKIDCKSQCLKAAQTRNIRIFFFLQQPSLVRSVKMWFNQSEQCSHTSWHCIFRTMKTVSECAKWKLKIPFKYKL